MRLKIRSGLKTLAFFAALRLCEKYSKKNLHNLKKMPNFVPLCKISLQTNIGGGTESIPDLCYSAMFRLEIYLEGPLLHSGLSDF